MPLTAGGLGVAAACPPDPEDPPDPDDPPLPDDAALAQGAVDDVTVAPPGDGGGGFALAASTAGAAPALAGCWEDTAESEFFAVAAPVVAVAGNPATGVAKAAAGAGVAAVVSGAA